MFYYQTPKEFWSYAVISMYHSVSGVYYRSCVRQVNFGKFFHYYINRLAHNFDISFNAAHTQPVITKFFKHFRPLEKETFYFFNSIKDINKMLFYILIHK